MNQAAAQTLFSLSDFVVVLPMILLFSVSLIPLMIKVLLGNKEINPITTLAFNLIGLIVATGMTLALAGPKATSFFADAVVMDDIAVWMSCLCYVIAGVALMLSYDHVATRGRQFTEFCFLLVSSVLGMVILIMSNDLIVTFIGLETMSLCLYILVAMSKEEILSKEASFKYFVLGSFASAIFLYGVALIYGTAGSTLLPTVAEQGARLLTSNRVFLAGVGLTILGFAFKVSVFPLHAWTPDVYTGAPTPVTAFMSTAVKTASFVAFLRFFDAPGFADADNLLTVVMWLAVLTMTIGNVAAVMQDNFKRILAYSSVAHSGYAMVGLIASGFGDKFEHAAPTLLFYLISYSFMTLGSFAIIGLFEKNENTIVDVRDLKGMAKRYPGLALSLTILMLSLAGIPPTLGFFGKFLVFSAAVEQDMYWLVFWGVINSVISVYYYLRPVVIMYMSEEEPIAIVGQRLMTRATVVGSAVVILVLGIFTSPVLRIVKGSVAGQRAAPATSSSVKDPASEAPAKQLGNRYERSVRGSRDSG